MLRFHYLCLFRWISGYSEVDWTQRGESERANKWKRVSEPVKLHISIRRTCFSDSLFLRWVISLHSSLTSGSARGFQLGKGCVGFTDSPVSLNLRLYIHKKLNICPESVNHQWGRELVASQCHWMLNDEFKKNGIIGYSHPVQLHSSPAKLSFTKQPHLGLYSDEFVVFFKIIE